MSFKDVEAELLNLARRHIIAYDGHGQFQFQFPVEQVANKLTMIEQDLKKLFRRIDTLTNGRFSNDNVVTQNIRSIASQYSSQIITYEQFTKFLFLHSLDASKPDRLLEQFKRDTRGGQPDMYQLQLWQERSPDNKVFATIETIFKKLREAINVLTTLIDDTTNDNDWHAIDLFAPELNYSYQERRTFHRHLLLLETLGLLHYISDPAMGQAMQITLLQPPIPRENLDINLKSLRLQEKHAKRKRHLMESYATNLDKAYYAEQFAQYFLGEHPLLAQNQHAFRSDLTPAQRAIARLTTGIHVIEGPAGCGKTTTLAEHIKHLVNQGTPIDHIMVTTHYRAAEGHIANALKQLESEGEVAISTTINAFGQKIFQQYRHLLKKPDGSLYYPGDQELQLLKDQGDSSDKELTYINQALKQATRTNFAYLITTQRWKWPATVDVPQFQSYYRSNATEEERFQAAIYRLRQFGIFPTPPPTREQLEEAIGKQTGVYGLAEFYAIYVLFLEIMASKNAYAFDDQVVFALAILRTQPDILREYQRYFEHVIIDELQDFTPAKIELLQLLCERHTNIMAFGDVYQDVGYERNKAKNEARVGAADVFARLTQQDHCGKHQLHHNFRSTQEILNMCSYLRQRVQRGAPSLQSATQKHGPLPAYVYTATENIHTLLDSTLEHISQLSPPEKESIALIFGNERLMQEAQKVLRERNIAFSLMNGQKEYYQLHHIKNLLLYFQLIEDPRRDEEMERLLRYNIVPYFDKSLIATLKQQASKAGISLFDALTSPAHLQQAKVSKEQQERLHAHLDIIRQRKLTDQVCLLEEHLLTLSDGPLTLLETQKKKMEEIQAMFAEFRTYSIGEALTETRRHILYLEAHKDRSDLVLATVKNAKSQEFETVFLLGIGSTYDKRLYVSASRAKQRLFFVGDRETFRSHGALSPTTYAMR